MIYCLASALLLGRHALADPNHVCACIGNGDPPSYMWALKWWPYAITHGTDPLYTHLAWSPTGDNVAAAPLIPLPSVLAWPLTATIGVLPSYDVITLLSPVLAATTAYLLCVYLTRRWLPSLAGGWVFGFSSYELTAVVGHAMLMMIALVPLMVLLVLLRLDRRVGRGLFVGGMLVLFAAQLLTSTEVLATSCGFGALALVIAWIAMPARRSDLARIAIELVAAGLVAAVITSPYLYEDFASTQPAAPPGAISNAIADLAGLVIPTQVTLLHYGQGVAAHFPGNIAEQSAYLGVPLLIVLCLLLWERRGRPGTWVLGGVALVALVLSLGPHLHIAGHSTIPLPAIAFPHLPVLRAVVPGRLTLYLWLVVAIATALWLATPGRWRAARWAVAIVGIALILPNGSSPLFSGRPSLPPLFTTDAYKRVIPRNGTALILPFGSYGPSMLWQAQTDFWFRMPEGALTVYPPPAFGHDPIAQPFFKSPTPVPPANLRAFLSRYHVNVVVVDPATAGGWPAALAAAGLKGRPVDGALVYEV